MIIFLTVKVQPSVCYWAQVNLDIYNPPQRMVPLTFFNSLVQTMRKRLRLLLALFTT